MPLFGKSHKNPTEIVKTLKDNLSILVKQDKKTEKASEEASKCLVAMKEILYGTNDKEPHTETVAQLAQELYNSGLLISLVENLQVIDFEGKKDVCQIFNNILRRQIGTRSPTVEYFCSHQEVLFILLKGYETPQVALNCGIMLRECIRHEPLAKIVLHSEHFKDFFSYVEMSTFDIASDAFATFKDLLTRHKVLVAEFLEQNYDAVFDNYEKLLHSENYVTKRQSLKLLGELLLDRHNFTVMLNFFFCAFLQVFVANPNKTQPIVDILLKNQTKLIDFLSNFQKDRTDDEQFNDEKTYLVKQIRDLKKPAS
ncbi:calcium-binding protein 39-like [Sinocyclocheilus rhinocerous]|uniref:calcium-binding protein 39-like n=1 Tax=Sinocyclocheilus rhinocerous TaxID=307959 RepID=UPI0007B99DD1|nr:PREDICTED: calcium-binding protein 39-like [Sinocyclocheilus rhinocerous]